MYTMIFSRSYNRWGGKIFVIVRKRGVENLKRKFVDIAIRGKYLLQKQLEINYQRDYFLQGLSTELKSPLRKGCRLIITLINNDIGFVKSRLNVFELRNTRNYHEDMKANVFESWFQYTILRFKPGSDNSSSRNIFHNSVGKSPLFCIKNVKIYNDIYIKYYFLIKINRR